MTGTARVIRADSRNLPLADDSVDLVVTSPPYFALRSYTDGGVHYDKQIGAEATPDEFVTSLLEVTAECVRVLKPSGSLWVNLGDSYVARQQGYGATTGGSWAKVHRHVGDDRDNGETRQDRRGGKGISRSGALTEATGIRRKSLIGIPWRYALRCIDELGLILRAEVIWSKPNGLPESVTDRVRRSHEQWFHFTLSPRYFSAVDEIREPHLDMSAHAMRRGERFSEYKTERLGAHTLTATNHPLGKLPGSVWTVPTEPLRVPEHLGVDHFAAFPTAWPRRIISAWCPEGGTVADVFGGTGTTALVAKALGRHGVSVDMSSDYCRLAQWRVDDPSELAKAARVEKPPAQVSGQGSLFGDEAAS